MRRSEPKNMVKDSSHITLRPYELEGGRRRCGSPGIRPESKQRASHSIESTDVPDRMTQ